VGGGRTCRSLRSIGASRSGYREVAEELIRRGHAYRCYCTPERLAEMREQQQQQGSRPGMIAIAADCRRMNRRGASPRNCRVSSASAMPLDGETVCQDAVFGEVRFDNNIQDDPVLLKSSGWRHTTSRR